MINLHQNVSKLPARITNVEQFLRCELGHLIKVTASSQGKQQRRFPNVEEVKSCEYFPNAQYRAQ